MADLTKGASTRRVQYAALPFRRRGNLLTEVMLVTSLRRGRWIIPKGWPMKRRAPYASAALEALEEAGVVGQVGKRAIGSFSYEKRLKQGDVILCKVHVFPLEVKRQQKSWPEKGKREVQWFSPSEAAERVQEPVLGDIIRSLQKRPNSGSAPRPQLVYRSRSRARARKNGSILI
jgi:8-oxo-dGTP pyrophosphatase MutT (NUDIX family)